MFYRIEERLIECTQEEAKEKKEPFVAVMTTKEWSQTQEKFQMGIDLEMELDQPCTTKAEVNYDSLTGTFSIPDRNINSDKDYQFAFALDETGIVFIDNHGKAYEMINYIRRSKRWRMPSLERFLYDFLIRIIAGDLVLLERYESQMNHLEDEILADTAEDVMSTITGIRGELLTLRTHYEQLIDLGQELQENENGFFNEDNLRYFDMFTARVSRLQDYVTTLREYTVQIRDLYQSLLSVKQNNIMKVLTVVTTVFMPLTLIVGWYGMNFRYMPELEYRYSYPILVTVCVGVVGLSLLYFKKKKWL
ncbi:MAG: magnesium transporter CorA [Verrucomicrobia bacterium]|nr:magnesium transporter CorA [Lachnospiraceae bacterium]MBR4249453.1 magnesium transporter CorA [Verrucomicrobiota bacterium]